MLFRHNNQLLFVCKAFTDFFVKETKGVYCAVRTDYWTIICYIRTSEEFTWFGGIWYKFVILEILFEVWKPWRSFYICTVFYRNLMLLKEKFMFVNVWTQIHLHFRKFDCGESGRETCWCQYNRHFMCSSAFLCWGTFDQNVCVSMLAWMFQYLVVIWLRSLLLEGWVTILVTRAIYLELCFCKMAPNYLRASSLWAKKLVTEVWQIVQSYLNYVSSHK